MSKKKFNISDYNGPQLILAGPGTGKTTTIVKKILELVENIKNKNDGILICTFTRKATEELKLKLYSKIPVSKFKDINFLIGTIHSISYELLARYSTTDYGDYEILTEEAQIHFIYSKLKNLGFSPDRVKKSGWYLAEELTAVFNKITDEQIDILSIDFTNNEDLEEYCKVYPTYKRILKKQKLFDFATIQETLLNELNNDKDFCELVRSEFNYFFVDEYQDVNNIQDSIFKKLAEPNYNITVVGDDDQSIYGFRGSNVDNIYIFKDWFVKQNIECKEHRLSKNYRSTSSIVYTTNSSIAQSSNKRLDKNLSANRDTKSHKPVVLEFNNDIEEAKSICDTIKKLEKNKLIKSHNDICIIFRSVKSHSEQVIKQLNAYKIPFKITGTGSLFDSTLGLEFMALIDLHLARDIDKLLLFSNSIADIDVKNKTDLTTLYTENDYINKLEFLFNSRKFSSCIDLTYEIFKTVDFLNRYSNSGINIGLLTSLILSFDDFSDFYDPWGLYSYLTYLKTSHKVDYIDEDREDAVNLMTIHQAKGLEFPYVFMPSLNERQPKTSIIDKFNKLIKSGINILEDEERRVFYVGCTRAEELLVLSYSKKLTNSKKNYEPVKYFQELIMHDSCVKSIDLKILEEQIFREKESNNKTELVLSYNKIKLYSICPLYYMYANVWNLQTVRIGGLEFGSNIHKILEVILKKVKEGISINKMDLDDIIETNWRNNNFRSDEENEKFKKAAQKQIKLFVANQSSLLESKQIFSIEDEFNILIENDLITGRFDAVFKTNNEYLLVDFKTGDFNDYTDQLSFYSLCFKKKYDVENLNLGIYFLKSGELKYITPKDEKTEMANIRNLSTNIKNKKFAATPGKHCGDCAYNTICEFSI